MRAERIGIYGRQVSLDFCLAVRGCHRVRRPLLSFHSPGLEVGTFPSCPCSAFRRFLQASRRELTPESLIWGFLRPSPKRARKSLPKWSWRCDPELADSACVESVPRTVSEPHDFDPLLNVTRPGKPVIRLKATFVFSRVDWDTRL